MSKCFKSAKLNVFTMTRTLYIFEKVKQKNTTDKTTFVEVLKVDTSDLTKNTNIKL